MAVTESAPAAPSEDQLTSEATRAAREQLDANFKDIQETDRLAKETGVPSAQDKPPEDLRKEDLIRDTVHSEAMNKTLYFDSAPLSTKKATISVGEGADAGVSEHTGDYATRVHGTLGNKGVSNVVQTTVVRSDGKGGTYRGSLGKSEKAANIVMKRANKEVKNAVIDRTIDMAEKLKAEREEQK